MSSSLSPEQRLVRYYTKYNPDKLATIPEILQAFKGRESVMFEQLIMRYGPEPTEDIAVASPSSTATPKRDASQPGIAPSGDVVPLPPPLNDGNDELRMRLYRYYNYYNPANCVNIEKLLIAYRSKQESLMPELVKKYGPEPSHRERLHALLSKYMPDKASKVDELLAKYSGKEETYIAAVVGKYGPEPILRQGQAPAASAPAASSPPSGQTTNAVVTTPVAAPAVTASAAQGSLADRIGRMIRLHIPAKADQVDALLTKYKGKEEEYLAALVGKYGAEPTGVAQSTTIAAAPQPVAVSEVKPAAAQATTQATVQERVTRMIEKYLPAKVSQIPALLEKYKGREDEYLAALVGKYGPEPTNESAPAASAAVERSSASDAQQPQVLERKESVMAAAPSAAAVGNSYKDRVTRMMQQYTPAKVGTVDAMLEKYKGREEDYIAALVGKHGPEPPATPSVAAAAAPLDASVRSEPPVERKASVVAVSAPPAPVDVKERIRRMIQQYLPAKVGQTEAMIEKYKGREDDYLAALVGKYGAEPALATVAAPVAVNTQPDAGEVAPPSLERKLSYKDRVTSMFNLYTPARVGTVDAMLEKYKGREEDYIAALVGKHGPEPLDASTRSEAAPSIASSSGADVKERISRMIHAYLPAKVGQIDALLEKYKHQEEEYLSALVGKYGPEPAAAPAATVVVPPQQQNEAAAPPAPSNQLTVVTTTPSPEAPQDGLASPKSSGDSNEEDVRGRLHRFYSTYQPDRIANIDSVLTKFAGRYNELFTQLVQKYGPEPQQEERPAAASEEPPRPATPRAATPRAAAGASTSKNSAPTPAAAQQTTSGPSVDWLATVEDPQERERLSAMAKAHGIAAVTDESVFKLLCSISQAIGPLKQSFSPSRANPSNAAASPERTALHARLFADSSTTEAMASPSRAALVTESWRDHGRQIAEATALQIVALMEVEQEERSALEDIDEDERNILLNAATRSQNQTLLKVQIERAVNGNTTSLRRKSFELWQLYAKARQQQRRITQVRGMSMYQRMQMTPLARKYYDSIRDQEEKQAEKARLQKELEIHERTERVRRQRVAVKLSGGQDFVSINKSRVAPSESVVPMLNLHQTSVFTAASASSPQRHSLRPPLERVRSPRHSTAVVYIDPKTGSAPVTPVSTGRPSLAKVVSMRGGPSPSSKADFHDRDARLRLIQQQFDLLPPAQKARVFRKLKKWDMVPVLDAQQQHRKQHDHGTTQHRHRYSGAHDISNVTDATSASLSSNHQMFSPSIVKTRPAASSPPFRGGGSRSDRRTGPLEDEEGATVGDEPPSLNVSHDALDIERVRMEHSRADKLFNSPFVEEVLVGGVADARLGAGATMTLSVRNLRSPQTPMSVSYIHEPSPMTPSARALEEDDVRAVVERLTFQSAVKNPAMVSVPSHRHQQEQHQQQNKQHPQQHRGQSAPQDVEAYDDDEYDDDIGADDEDLHTYMLETLRDAMRGGSHPRTA